METVERLSQLRERMAQYMKGTGDAVQSVRQGLEVVSKLDVDQLGALVDLVATYSDDPSFLMQVEPHLKKKTGVADEDFQSASNAVFFLSIPVLAEDADDDELVHALADGLQISSRACLRDIVRAIHSIRVKFNSVLQRGQVANQTLPTLTTLSTSVDVRLRFDQKGKVSLAVPVALCFLQTDVEGGSFAFQMSATQLKKMKGAVDKLYDELAHAQAFLNEKVSA